jgi:hypothetical protein
MKIHYRTLNAAAQRTRPGSYIALYETGKPHDAVRLLLNMWMGVAGAIHNGCSQQICVDGEPVSSLELKTLCSGSLPYVRFCFRTGKYLPSSDEVTAVPLTQVYRFWVKRRKIQGPQDFRSIHRVKILPYGGIEAVIRIQRLQDVEPLHGHPSQPY